MNDRHLRYFGCDLGTEQPWLAEYWKTHEKALRVAGLDIGWYYKGGEKMICVSVAESIEIKPTEEDFSQTFYPGVASGEWRDRLSRFVVSLGLSPDTDMKWGIVYLDRGKE